jgi:hypothetical protein
VFVKGSAIAWMAAGMLVAAGAMAAEPKRAVEVSIGGIGPAVDEYAYRTVRQVIGMAVANGTVDHMVVYGYGKEGGFSGCLAASPFARDDAFTTFVRQLRTITVNPETSAYSVMRVEACAPAQGS